MSLVNRLYDAVVDWKPFGREAAAAEKPAVTMEAQALPDGQEPKQEVKAELLESLNGFGLGNWTPVGSFAWDGEKVPGEMGTIKRYHVTYRRLTLRSWQKFIESDVSQAIIRKYCRWIIGAGLKLHAEPVESIIEASGVTFDKSEFNKSTEARFGLFAKSKRASYDGQMSLNKISLEAKIHAVVGGDCLIIQRVEDDGRVTEQLIDGERVETPILRDGVFKEDKAENRTVRFGIVFNERGEHEAYYVRTPNSKTGYERFKARDDNGQLVAFLVYGLRYRIDNVRGIPLATAILQTVAQLDRYKEATVGSAEERQKVVYSIEHQLGGTGEGIHGRQIEAAISRGLNRELSDTVDPNSEALNDLLAATTSKQVPNLPPGAQLKALSSQNELSFEPFMRGQLILLCATIGIPYEVAVSKYDSNFSASRAALKDWEHTIMTDRADWSENFYQPIYELWLNMQVMQNKIQAEPLVQALSTNDRELYEAVTCARFTGTNVPHIDPLKEVQAERAKLGPQGAAAPLTTPQKATESLGTGEFDENAERFNEQVEDFQPPEPEPPEPPEEEPVPPSDEESEEGEQEN